MLKLEKKKVGKPNRPFIHGQNLIPYDYTVEVKNRFKVLDLVDGVLQELHMEVLNCIGNSYQHHPKE